MTFGDRIPRSKSNLVGLIQETITTHDGLFLPASDDPEFIAERVSARLRAEYILLPRDDVYEAVTERANGACRHTFHVSHNWRDGCPG